MNAEEVNLEQLTNQQLFGVVLTCKTTDIWDAVHIGQEVLSRYANGLMDYADASRCFDVLFTRFEIR